MANEIFFFKFWPQWGMLRAAVAKLGECLNYYYIVLHPQTLKLTVTWTNKIFNLGLCLLGGLENQFMPAFHHCDLKMFTSAAPHAFAYMGFHQCWELLPLEEHHGQ